MSRGTNGRIWSMLDNFSFKFSDMFHHDTGELRANSQGVKWIPFVIQVNKILSIVVLKKSDNCSTISHSVTWRYKIKTLINVSCNCYERPHPATVFKFVWPSINSRHSTLTCKRWGSQRKIRLTILIVGEARNMVLLHTNCYTNLFCSVKRLLETLI